MPVTLSWGLNEFPNYFSNPNIIIQSGVLSLYQIEQITASTIRLTYTIPPLMRSSGGLTDSLNITNYNIFGPNSVSISSVVPVSGAPTSVDLLLNNTLSAGLWTVTVSGVKTAGGIPLTTPFSLSFYALTSQQLITAANGATSQSAQDILRQFLNPALTGPNWNALIAAIATGDTYLTEFAQDVTDQLFISTASGIYLDRKLGDLGIVRPPYIGIPDPVFSQLGIKINAHKLTLEALLEVLNAYYGDDAMRASIDSVNAQPYDISNNSDLQISVEGTVVTILFNSTDFANSTQATALEVATVINRYFQYNGLNDFAEPIMNPSTGLTFVRVYSGALGLRGAIQVLGGRAQNILQFPTVLNTTQAIGTTWQVDIPDSLSSLTGSTVRFTYTGTGTNPTLTLVQDGDYVTVYGTIWNSNNIGSFTINNVTSTYFEISNSLSIAQTAIAQIANNDLEFYRPTRFTINSKNRISLVAQGDPNVTDVILSATTQAVSRQEFEASYVQQNTTLSLSPSYVLNAGSMVRSGGNTVTVTTPVTHDLLTNDLIYIGPGETNFPEGVKTITAVGSNTFTYTETGSNVASANINTVYPNFRDSSGTVHLTTTATNGFVDDQWVYVDGLTNAINTVGGLGFNATISNSGSTLIFRQAVTLQNGLILVCGGEDQSTTKYNLTYLYNTATNTWTVGPNMNYARSRHTATVLEDGRVLVVGGANSVTTPEIYYPNLNIWVNAAHNSVNRSYHSAVLLNDGTALIVGGGDASYEIFTPATESWTVGSLPYDIQGTQALLLQNGTVLVAGGFNSGFVEGTNTALLYNPFLKLWRNTVNDMPNATFFYSGITENVGTSGLAYIIGGTTLVGDYYLTDVQIFEPNTEIWTSGPSLNTGRYFTTVANLPNHQIMVYGGSVSSDTDTSTYEILDYVYGTAWSQNTGPVDETNPIAVQIENDVLIVAGYSINSTASDYLYVPQSSSTITNSGKINGLYSISVITNNQFTYLTPDNQTVATLAIEHLDNVGNTVNASVLAFKAVENPLAIGPYSFDTTDGYSITGTQTTLNQTINAGISYSRITVTNAASFPTSGYLIFNFGYENQTAPVQYYAKASNTQLIINPAFKFLYNIPTGAQVNLLYTNGPFIPTSADLGAFYLTDSISGRIAAESTINQIVAAGVNINITINYPGSIGLGNGYQPTNIITPKVNDIVWIFGNQDDLLEAQGLLPSGAESAV